MAISMAGFTFNDALTKSVTAELTVAQIMFVRGAHDGNDSRILRVERGFRVPQEDIPRLLAERFAIDLDGFAAALAAAEEGRDGR